MQLRCKLLVKEALPICLNLASFAGKSKELIFKDLEIHSRGYIKVLKF